MHLTINLLGPFKAEIQGQAPVESRAKKIEALLAFLATEADRAHRRERLVGLLFPEMPEDQARTNLRQTLTRLRRAISDQAAEPPFLLISRESTQFNKHSDHTLDVADFVEHMEGCDQHRGERDPYCQNCMNHLAAGVGLYHGPFLEGFSLAESVAFEEWILAKREYFEQVLLTALRDLADHDERHGRYAEASHHVRLHLQIEPWNEAANQQLMRVLAYQGQRAAALQQYETFEALLQRELAVEPMPETRALRDKIRAAAPKRPYALPARYETFVGRDEEIALLHDYLADPNKRLITVTGPGGSGKTALVIESGWRAATHFMGPFLDGVFFVPLAGISIEQSSNGSGSVAYYPLLTALSEAVSFSFSGTRPPHEQLLRYLEGKSLLLIFDNAEHVITQVRAFLHVLLERAPGVTMLITSRERLGLSTEWVIEIEGLPYPHGEYSNNGDQAPDMPALMAQYDALALFETLGKRLIPDFELQHELNEDSGHCLVTAAQRIVEQVHGLPLGIELAASWLRILNCTEIADEIAQSIDFLRSTMHDSPSRHRSLRAVFDSSWQLLDEEEQIALQQLSVFYGPFDRAAAAAVSGAGLTMLSDLVDHSMLHRVEAGEGGAVPATYELLHVLRQFAAEKLAREPQATEQARERHARYFLHFLADQQGALQGPEQDEAVQLIVRQMKEIRPAWRWAVRQHNLDLLARALDSLALYLYMRSWFVEGAELFDWATTVLADERDKPRGRLLWARLRARQGWFEFLCGHQQGGRDHLLESVDRLRALGEPAALASALSFSAAALAILGEYKTARDWAVEALALTESYGDEYGSAIANNILSQIAFQQSDFGAAQRYSEASLAIERALGNQWSIGFSLTNLGRVAFARERYADAQEYFRESLAIREALQDKRGQALCLRYMGEAARAQGDAERAQRYLAASLAIFRSIGSQDETAATLNSLGRLALQSGEEKAAQHSFSEALHIARRASSVPRLLEAVTGIATLLAASAPLRSAQIAAMIQDHPAANRISRQQATELVASLPQVGMETRSPGETVEVSWQKLAQLGEDLLSQLDAAPQPEAEENNGGP